jgi:ethanolamine transporter
MAMVSQVIVYIMLLFMLVGVVDKVFLGGRFGYGAKFEEGMAAMGTLALSMVGIMSFAPVLGQLLAAPVGAVFGGVGADPAMFAGSILANDMGGYNLSKAMTADIQIQHLSGLFMGAMMGATIVFSIPVSLGIIEKEDRPFLAKGMLAGFISIPFGAFIASFLDGVPVGKIIVNLVPSVVLAVLFAVGLALIPNGMMKGFNVFAIFISAFGTLTLALAIVRHLGFGGGEIPFLPFAASMDQIGPQLETCGVIAITLAGAYPMVHFITTVFGRPLEALGKAIGVNDKAAAGMVAALANNIPMFGMMKDMDERGKVLAVAFSVCASFALGDHLGFTAGQDAAAIFPTVAGKVLGGVIGVIVASLLVARSPKKASA